jgi:hypothetical protein
MMAIIAFMRASSKPNPAGASKRAVSSALTGLEARIDLVDDENTALPANEPVGTVAPEKGLERVLDLHGATLTKGFRERNERPRRPLENSAGP